MRPETFRRRLEAGRCNNLLYTDGVHEGLIIVWKYQEAFVLTWEECPMGEQYDESLYTRDERHVLASVDEVLRFLDENGLDVDKFRP